MGVCTTLLKLFFCIFNKSFLLSISLDINFIKFLLLFFLSIRLFENVSFKPPLTEVITAQPLDALSRAVLPKGSSQVGLTTEIED